MLTHNGRDFATFSNATRCSDVVLQWPLASSASFPYGRPGDINYAARRSCWPFRMVRMWSLLQVDPQLGPEKGNSVVDLFGQYFLTSTATVTCIFRDPSINLTTPGVFGTSLIGTANVTSPINGTCRSPPRILTRPKVFLYDQALESCLFKRPYDALCPRTSSLDCNGLRLNNSVIQVFTHIKYVQQLRT